MLHEIHYFQHCLKELEKVIKLVEKSSINQIKIEEDGTKIEIIKEDGIQQVPVEQQVIYQPMPQPVAPAATTPAVAPDLSATKEGQLASDEIAITAPMVGTFYASSSPEVPVYVKIGDRINVGDPVCIIEAMKLFNEIESESAGTIVKILAKNEDPIEFGQELFIIKKDA